MNDSYEMRDILVHYEYLCFDDREISIRDQRKVQADGWMDEGPS